MFSQCQVLFLTNLDVFLGSSDGGGKTANAFLIILILRRGCSENVLPLGGLKGSQHVAEVLAIRDPPSPLERHSRIRMDHRPQSRVGFLCSDINFLLISSSAGHDAEEGRGECWCQGLIRAEGPGAAEPKLVLVSS